MSVLGEKFTEVVNGSGALPKNLWGKKISTEAREELERKFELEEIKFAVWSCGVDKSPSPDGFNFHFFRQFWDLVKNDFAAVFEDFFKHSKLVRGLKSSFITLIPKSGNPIAIEDFRPISLIGCIYKVVAKALASKISYLCVNRLLSEEGIF